jgi:hypothetical protein
LFSGWIGGRCMATLPPEVTGDEPQRAVSLILFVDVSVKRVFDLGREFPWSRPRRCSRCGGRLWGHGFCPAYFDGLNQPLWLRRYRCRDCGRVFRLRPKGYWSRFQAPISVIHSSIARRLQTGRWPPGFSRSRGGHWLRALIRRVLAFLGHQWKGRWLEGFDRLCEMGRVPVCRSI